MSQGNRERLVPLLEGFGQVIGFRLSDKPKETRVTLYDHRPPVARAEGLPMRLDISPGGAGADRGEVGINAHRVREGEEPAATWSSSRACASRPCQRSWPAQPRTSRPRCNSPLPTNISTRVWRTDLIPFRPLAVTSFTSTCAFRNSACTLSLASSRLRFGCRSI